jgi:2-enoate reductase
MGKYDALFTPVNIGNVSIKNRYAMAPMVLVHDDNYTEVSRAYYLERAAGGVGLIITYANKADREVESFDLYGGGDSPRIDYEQLQRNMRILTDGMKRYGTKFFVQITAGIGRSMMPYLCTGNNTIAPSPITNRWADSIHHREISVEEIHKIIKSIGKYAKTCKDGGADGVEVHALHEGYLLDCFALSFFNKRQDEYGGSLENRLRFAKEIREEIAEQCGVDFPVSMRFSLKSFIKDYRVGGLPDEDFDELGRDVGEGLVVARLLEQYGYDALNVDAGTYDSWFWAHPPYFQKRGLYLPFAEAVKNAVNIPVMCAGMMGDPDLALDALESGKLDIVCLGRPHIADPDICKKIQADDTPDIRPCLYCHEGCIGRRKSRCTVNARAGHELDRPKLSKVDKGKEVAIIGAGPAGMECARLLAGKGHSVSVYEKSDKAGGLFNYAAIPDFKPEAGELIKWWTRQLRKLGVKTRFNTNIDASDGALQSADIIITATGSNDLIPPINGIDKPHVVTAKQALSNIPQEGELVIIGAGLVGCEIGIWFAQRGRKITLVEMQDGILPKGAPEPNKMMIERYIDYYSIRVCIGAKLVQVKDASVLLDRGGETLELPAGKVILSLGYRPDDTLYKALKEKYPNVVNIGDSNVVSDVLDACYDAYEACKDI